MAKNKKPRKAYKNKTLQRALKLRMRSLPLEMDLITRPLDNFFDQVCVSGEIDDVNGTAVFVNDMNQQMMSVKDCGRGLLDSLADLFKFKKQGEELIQPMRHLFENIDNQDFTFDEIDAAADAWDEAKRILRDCTYGEVVYFSNCDWKYQVMPHMPKGLKE